VVLCGRKDICGQAIGGCGIIGGGRGYRDVTIEALFWKVWGVGVARQFRHWREQRDKLDGVAIR